MNMLAFAVAALAILAAGSGTTARGEVTPEVRPYVGAFFPTGDQRDVLKDGVIVGVQMGFEIDERVHLLGTFGWVPNKDRVRTLDRDLNLYQYDLGLEIFSPVSMTDTWQLRPFLGAGMGGRTYDPKAGSTETNLAGYGSLGAEFQTGRLALRLEGRDYLTRFKGLDGAESATTRNDIVALTGLSIHW